MQQLDRKYQPVNLEDFIGMDKPKKILAAFSENPYSSAWLFLGSSGIGKTTMALAMAHKIDAQIHHIPARKCDLETVERISRSCYYRPMEASWGHVVIADEADRMSRPAQLAFLSLLDCTAPPPDTIFIFTTNDTTLLEGRFLSRCKILRFSTEGLGSAGTGLLERIYVSEMKGSKQKRSSPDFEAMMKSADSNIRTAIGYLEQELLYPGSFEPSVGTPQPIRIVSSSRSEAAKRAWITIRAKRARKAG